jgi:DNA repair protein RadA/Sms
VTLEGRRPLIAEVQSLVTTRDGPHPRRAVSGLDSSRLAMLIAVLHRRLGLDLTARDVYASTVGGASLRGPATDLAVAVALASAAVDRAVPVGTITIGEVGLAGELRRVPNLLQRLSEAARLGFTTAVVPASHAPAPARMAEVPGLTVVECPDLRSALRAASLGPRRVLSDLPGLQVVS